MKVEWTQVIVLLVKKLTLQDNQYLKYRYLSATREVVQESTESIKLISHAIVITTQTQIYSTMMI